MIRGEIAQCLHVRTINHGLENINYGELMFTTTYFNLWYIVCVPTENLGQPLQKCT